MFIDNTSKRVNISAPYIHNGKRYNLSLPEVLQQFGIHEIPDPVPPADFSDDTYYRTEQQDAPYVIFTRKSDEQINQTFNARLDQQIDSLEGKYPRAVREFMLGLLEAQFTPEQLAENIGYKNVKSLDTEIAALRRTRK